MNKPLRTLARAQKNEAARIRNGLDARSPIQAKKPERDHKPGLVFLHAKGRLTDRQLLVGVTYGKLLKAAHLDPSKLKSNIDDSSNGVRGGGAPTYPGSVCEIAKAEKLDAARKVAHLMAAVLQNDISLTSVLEAVCEHGLAPREVNPDQRAAAEIEVVLKVGLDLLGPHIG